MTTTKAPTFRGRLPGIGDFDAGALACADCGAACSLGHVQGLHADVKAGRRKVLCGRCIKGGPAVVTVVEATSAVDLAQALEAVAADATDEPETPPPLALGVSFAKACVVEGINEPRRGSERDQVRTLLLARGWTTAQPEGAGRVLWWQPVPHERRPGERGGMSEQVERNGTTTPCPECGRVMRPPEVFLRAELEGLTGPLGNTLVCVVCGEMAALEVELNEKDPAACREALAKFLPAVGLRKNVSGQATAYVERHPTDCACRTYRGDRRPEVTTHGAV